jgi:hypothetical protein
MAQILFETGSILLEFLIARLPAVEISLKVYPGLYT